MYYPVPDLQLISVEQRSTATICTHTPVSALIQRLPWRCVCVFQAARGFPSNAARAVLVCALATATRQQAPR